MSDLSLSVARAAAYPLRPAPADRDEVAASGTCGVSACPPRSLNARDRAPLLCAGGKGSQVTVIRSGHVSGFQQTFLLPGFLELKNR